LFVCSSFVPTETDGRTTEGFDSTSSTGIVELKLEEKCSLDNGAVEATLRDYYGRDVAGQALTPPDNPADLRDRLRAAAPRLATVAANMQNLFDQGAVGVFVSKLGLADLEVDQRRKSVFALAVLLGDVTETEPVDHRVIWDLQTKPEELREFSRFSQADGEAQYHTDSTIVPRPERYFLLYAVQQASCGGGVSFLRDGRLLKKRLEETPEGRSAIRVLSDTNLPIRIPKWCRAKYGYPESEKYAFMPIMSDQPLWRWRRDKIERGLVKHPDCATPAVRTALGTVDALLANPADELRNVIPSDGIVIIDNHVAFHGRTAFTDSRRHLLRIRFNEPTA
jgi:alpha-ketoglutarate-dependent taurine dioxygenase